MPRDLALGNGRLLVTFDATYTLRDLYFPHVGQENHTLAHACRTGVWVEGRFAWFSDDGWKRQVSYRPDSLVSDVLLEHPGLQLRIHASDAVHPELTLFLRSFNVTNLSDRLREVRLFVHQDLYISERDIGDTASYEPVNRSMGHYKGRRYFVINGRTGDGQGIFQYATGFKDAANGHGTWRDAEDGWLEMNPIAQGSVDSTVSFRQNIPAGGSRMFSTWVGVEKDYWDVRALNLKVLGTTRPLSVAESDHERVAVPEMIALTDAHWKEWVGRAPRDTADLSDGVMGLYRRSLLMIASQVDHDGAILAANDGDSVQYNRDTYSYMWPRDGALVAATLDRCGYFEVTEQFFRFCARLMPRGGYYPEGYLMHKFHPDGSLGSSWHPWVRNGQPSLSIQEDETALVLWALWHHLDLRQRGGTGVSGLLAELARRLVVPAARFLLLYRDEQEGRNRFGLRYRNPATGLPLASYDLWEERYGIHAFTVITVIAGLRAASKLLVAIAAISEQFSNSPCEVTRDGQHEANSPPKEELQELAWQCDAAADRMKRSFVERFWAPDRNGFGRALTVDAEGGTHLDATLDASTMYAMSAFGVFLPAEPGVRETIGSIEERLWCNTPVGGIARYENDHYHRTNDDVPGNPWVICTLWSALGQIFLAQDRSELAKPKRILEWCCARCRPSGVLAEQVHSYAGTPLSVAPLTWSHATFVEAVRAYVEKSSRI